MAESTSPVVLAHDPRRRTNAQAIADLAALGRLRATDRVLDVTYGRGTFWRQWQPAELVGSDIDPAHSPSGLVVDFRRLAFPDNSFDVVVFDPPYGLRDTARLTMDRRYGIDTYRSPTAIAELIRAGTVEAMRVADRAVLVKTQDQIAGGRQHWQTVDVHLHANTAGWVVVEELHVTAPVPQPPGRRQIHARGRPSTLLVLERSAVARRGREVAS